MSFPLEPQIPCRVRMEVSLHCEDHAAPSQCRMVAPAGRHLHPRSRHRRPRFPKRQPGRRRRPYPRQPRPSRSSGRRYLPSRRPKGRWPRFPTTPSSYGANWKKRRSSVGRAPAASRAREHPHQREAPTRNRLIRWRQAHRTPTRRRRCRDRLHRCGSRHLPLCLIARCHR